MNSSRLIFTDTPGQALDRVLVEIDPASSFVLVDSNTGRSVLPRLQSQSKLIDSAKIITIEAGEAHKNLDSLAQVWTSLSNAGATRHSVLVNVGGGVVTDLGGLAAATFKRGMKCINMPTTLLAAVDASLGGKTGIDFNGLKNEIGVFSSAEAVIITSCFFDTLPREELLSGYAEMIKHSLLSSRSMFNAVISTSIDCIAPGDMLKMIEESIAVKAGIVSKDPTEKGLRRALNLGHTAGHAFEAMALKAGKPVTHGCAVAHGLVVALILSHFKYGLPTGVIYSLATYVRSNYGVLPVSCDNYQPIMELMAHDKKNVTAHTINFTLLREIGETDVLLSDNEKATVGREDITAALDIYRDLMGM